MAVKTDCNNTLQPDNESALPCQCSIRLEIQERIVLAVEFLYRLIQRDSPRYVNDCVTVWMPNSLLTTLIDALSVLLPKVMLDFMRFNDCLAPLHICAVTYLFERLPCLNLE